MLLSKIVALINNYFLAEGMKFIKERNIQFGNWWHIIFLDNISYPS